MLEWKGLEEIGSIGGANCVLKLIEYVGITAVQLLL